MVAEVVSSISVVAVVDAASRLVMVWAIVVELAVVLEWSLISGESVEAELVPMELQKELATVGSDSFSIDVGVLISRLDYRRVVDAFGRHGDSLLLYGWDVTGGPGGEVSSLFVG